MKNALKMMLAYLLVLVIGTFVGIVIVVEFLASSTLIAGRTAALITGGLVARAFFVAAPIVIAYSGVFLSVYAVRHHAKKMIAAITYIILCLITWGVVFPAFLTLPSVVENSNRNAGASVGALSSGYFRKVGKFIYYVTNDTSSTRIRSHSGVIDFLEEVPKDSVVIHTDDTSPETMMREVSGGSDMLENQAKPFTDILIRDTMDFKFLPIFYDAFNYFMTAANTAWKNGILSWICFASFGFALCSVYAFIGFSHWRIINTLLVIFASSLITIFNYLYYTNIFSSIKNTVASWGGIFSYIDSPFLVIVNFSVTIVFVIIGLIVLLVRSSKERDDV